MNVPRDRMREQTVRRITEMDTNRRNALMRLSALPMVLAGPAAAADAKTAAPFLVPNSASYDRQFHIELTSDRNDETQPIVDEAPNVRIVETNSRRVLAEFPFAADTASDMQPLRYKIAVHWASDSAAVAMVFSERHYSHLRVYQQIRENGMPTKFAESKIPDTAKIIQAMVPMFKEFRSRWHHHVVGWSGQRTLIFTAGADAITEPRPNGSIEFDGWYQFTVGFEDGGIPIIRRVQLPDEV